MFLQTTAMPEEVCLEEERDEGAIKASLCLLACGGLGWGGGGGSTRTFYMCIRTKECMYPGGHWREKIFLQQQSICKNKSSSPLFWFFYTHSGVWNWVSLYLFTTESPFIQSGWKHQLLKSVSKGAKIQRNSTVWTAKIHGNSAVWTFEFVFKQNFTWKECVKALLYVNTCAHVNLSCRPLTNTNKPQLKVFTQ